jgi:Pantoate-beta-alanine ligase
VKHSLAENDLTVVSIFVNPAQFAPHEDLATYPRTFPQDLNLLSLLEHKPADPPHAPRTPSAVFLPSVKDMYPSGISQDVSQQKGTFVEVKGYGEQMEGSSRPTFFRGVTTVVTKLFNIIQVRTLSQVFFFKMHIECSTSSANECLLWPEGHPAGTPPASPRRRSAPLPSDTRSPAHRPHRPRRHKRPCTLLAQCIPHPCRAPTSTRILRGSPGRSTGVGSQREQTGSRAARA